jgi:hypothetical protein
MALDHSCQVQRHPHSERGLDLYETPSGAVHALLRAEPWLLTAGTVWKCAVPVASWTRLGGRGFRALGRRLPETSPFALSRNAAFKSVGRICVTDRGMPHRQAPEMFS